MKTIIVDDEPWMLQYFSNECKSVEKIEIVGSFQIPQLALDYAKGNEVELAFLDIEMPNMDGIELGKKLHEAVPGINIILVSAYDYSTVKERKGSLECRYLMKPYDREGLQSTINEILHKN